MIHQQDWEDNEKKYQLFNNGLKGIKRKLSVLSQGLSGRSDNWNEFEEIDDDASPDHNIVDGTRLFQMFRVGWRYYHALRVALDSYLTQYRSARQTLQRGIVESLQDLRRYLKLMSVLLRKGGIYDRDFHKLLEDKKSSDWAKYGKLN